MIKYLESILSNLLISSFFVFDRRKKWVVCSGNSIVKNATIKKKRRGDARG